MLSIFSKKHITCGSRAKRYAAFLIYMAILTFLIAAVIFAIGRIFGISNDVCTAHCYDNIIPSFIGFSIGLIIFTFKKPIRSIKEDIRMITIVMVITSVISFSPVKSMLPTDLLIAVGLVILAVLFIYGRKQKTN